MNRRFGLWLAAGAVSIASFAVALRAATPTFWTVSSQGDFLKGDVEDLSIDSDGRVVLGPTAALVAETSAPFIWIALPTPDGGFFAGTGNEGKVLRVAKDGRVTTFFDAGELEVHALANAPNGGLYVGTSPDGRIYHVAANGTSKPFFDPEDKYIWSLAVDKAGNVFAATGDKGVIYKIAPDGRGTTFYKTNATNVVTLAFDRAGELLAGTASPGRLFRIDSAGKAFVLLDSPYREIHALRLAPDGTIYAAAVNAPQSSDRPASPEPPVTESPRPPVGTVSAEITGVSVIESGVGPGASPSPPRSSRRSGRGGIYRIQTDGLWDLVWDSGEDHPYDLIVEPAGSLLVGTGTEGKIFRIAGEPARATLLARAGARQVTSLMRESSGRIVGTTSNPGKLFSIGAQPARRGSYDSDVRDAGTVATWGVIRWRAATSGGQVELFTRSGNTATPDRDLERMVQSVYNRGRRTDPESERPLPAVACRADGRHREPRAHVGDSSLPAPQPAAGDCLDHRPSARHRVSAPVLDWRPGDRRLSGQLARRPARDHPVRARPVRRRSGAASIRRGSRRSSGRLRTVTRIGWTTTCPIGARVNQAGGCCSARLAIRSSCGTRLRFPTERIS